MDADGRGFETGNRAQGDDAVADDSVTFQTSEWSAIELLCRVGHRIQRDLDKGIKIQWFRRWAKMLERVALDVDGAVEMNRLVGNGRGGYDDAKCRANGRKVREIIDGQWDAEFGVTEILEAQDRMPVYP